MSVISGMGAILDDELQQRGVFGIGRTSCNRIIEAVVSRTAAAAAITVQAADALKCRGCAPQALDLFSPSSHSASPLTEHLDGGRMPVSAVFFSGGTLARRAAMARRFERADQCRLHLPHDDGRIHGDVLIDGAELTWIAAMIRGPDHDIPSSATPAPRTSDGGRGPSGGDAAPAVTHCVTPAQQAYALLWRVIRSESPLACKARHVLLRSLTAAEQAEAIAWVKLVHPLRDGEE